jgi:hypothetical protein
MDSASGVDPCLTFFSDVGIGNDLVARGVLGAREVKAARLVARFTRAHLQIAAVKAAAESKDGGRQPLRPAGRRRLLKRRRPPVSGHLRSLTSTQRRSGERVRRRRVAEARTSRAIRAATVVERSPSRPWIARLSSPREEYGLARGPRPGVVSSQSWD